MSNDEFAGKSGGTVRGAAGAVPAAILKKTLSDILDILIENAENTEDNRKKFAELKAKIKSTYTQKAFNEVLGLLLDLEKLVVDIGIGFEQFLAGKSRIEAVLAEMGGFVDLRESEIVRAKKIVGLAEERKLGSEIIEVYKSNLLALQEDLKNFIKKREDLRREFSEKFGSTRMPIASGETAPTVEVGTLTSIANSLEAIPQILADVAERLDVASVAFEGFVAEFGEAAAVLNQAAEQLKTAVDTLVPNAGWPPLEESGPGGMVEPAVFRTTGIDGATPHPLAPQSDIVLPPFLGGSHELATIAGQIEAAGTAFEALEITGGESIARLESVAAQSFQRIASIMQGALADGEASWEDLRRVALNIIQEILSAQLAASGDTSGGPFGKLFGLAGDFLVGLIGGSGGSGAPSGFPGTGDHHPPLSNSLPSVPLAETLFAAEGGSFAAG